jgi:ATP-binding cassette subfamily B protein
MEYETPLRPGGAGISGGRRQRIALARALITGLRCLIMDEVTSALDQKTENELFSSLRTLGCTLIVIYASTLGRS